MKRVGMLLVLLALTGCAGCDTDGATGGEPGADATARAQCASRTSVASIPCVYTAPIPLNILPQPMDANGLTFLVDGEPVPVECWSLTNSGHTVTLSCPVCGPGTGDFHLVEACRLAK